LRIIEKYIAECDNRRSVRSKKRGRVLSFKFITSDNWEVTPVECLIIAYKLRLYLMKKLPTSDDARQVYKWVEAFADFNEAAARYGGYYV
jgi:hypothetical protein